jgi:hypothetical protein
MGRPRKHPRDRLTRTITARVSDEQFDWLIERMDDGEFSASLRNTIDLARVFEVILQDRDPAERFKQFLEDSEKAEARQAYFDEFGKYPEDDA